MPRAKTDLARPDYWLTADGLALVGGWARDGLSEEQIAEKMGVPYSAFRRWKGQHPDLATVLGYGKEVADRHVENALYKRAVGYEYEETKTVTAFDANGNLTSSETVTKKQMAPDVVAQIFWLKNRKPAEWRDRQEIGLDGAVGLVQIVDDLPKK